MHKYESFGKLCYNPERGKNQSTSWWLVVDVDKEITRYYRWWVKTEIGILLQQPSWNAHISVIRGAQPPNPEFWRKYEQKTIGFQIKHEVRQSGDTTGWDRPDNYWFVDVFSEELSHIQQEMGFPAKDKYHITIGRTR